MSVCRESGEAAGWRAFWKRYKSCRAGYQLITVSEYRTVVARLGNGDTLEFKQASEVLRGEMRKVAACRFPDG